MAVIPLICVTFVLLASTGSSLHFPGLVSKDYAYNQELPVRTSYYLTTKGPSQVMKDYVAKGVVTLTKMFYAPRFPLHEAFDMCHPNYGRDEF